MAAPVAVQVRREPVVLVGAALPFVAVLLSAFGVHATQTQTAAIATIVTAVLGLISAAMVQPANIAVIHSTLATVIVAAAAFGLHLDPAQVALVTGAVTALFGSLLREKVSPAAGTRPTQT